MLMHPQNHLYCQGRKKDTEKISPQSKEFFAGGIGNPIRILLGSAYGIL